MNAASERQQQRRSWRLKATALLVAGAILAFLFLPALQLAALRSRFVDAVNNGRQLRQALDAFANDHGGAFPSPPQGSPAMSSNQCLRDTLARPVDSASYWVKGSPVCSRRRPEDGTGTFAPGAFHWAYLGGQSKRDNPARPLFLDPFVPGTTRFDPALWSHKVVIGHVDGSIKAYGMHDSSGKVRDGSNRDLFARDADAWEGSGLNPLDLLLQPEPPAP